MISFQCPYCEKDHQAPENTVDKFATCECGQKIRSPKPGEKIFHDRNGILISSLRIQFDGNTITPQSIESVRHASVPPNNLATSLCAPFAVFCALWFFGTLISFGTIDILAAVFGFAAVIFTGLAVGLYGKGTRTYFVEFSTTARKYRIADSSNKAEVQRIATSLQTAMAR